MPYLYRGTTVGWPGNDCLQRVRLTPTSVDPLVATLFAIECARFGKAVVVAVDAGQEQGMIHESVNCLEQIEREVVLKMTPIEFAGHAAAISVPLEIARQA